jgi:hypothetical protein
MRIISNSISWIFQPLIMPLFAAFIFMNLPVYAFRLLPLPLKHYVFICNALFTLLIPVLMILLLHRFGFISSLQLERREERRFPLLLTLIFYGLNFYFLYKVHLPALYYLFLLAALLSLLMSGFITRFWKISMHMTGIGGLCGSILLCAFVWQVDLRILLAFLFLLAGAIGSARLILNAHTPMQVLAGFFNGFLPQLAILLLV